MINRVCICGQHFSIYPYRKLTAKFCSANCQRKFRFFKKGYKNIKGSLAKTGDKNPMWNNYKEKVEIQTIHKRIQKIYPKPINCELCGLNKKLELSNKDHKYSLNKNDYQWICKKCHHSYDGHEKYLELGRIGENYL